MLHSRPGKESYRKHGAHGPYFVDLVDTADGIGYPTTKPPKVWIVELENEQFDFEEDDETPIGQGQQDVDEASAA